MTCANNARQTFICWSALFSRRGFHGGWPVEDYLRDRVETLVSLIPDAVEFYIRDSFVMQAIGDGFNLVQFVHEYLPGSYVDVWTIDHGKPWTAKR
ncbi:MAG: hypothetical protein WD314_14125 [Trueperaceae bacterium]